MKMTKPLVASVALAAIVAAGLSTVALAERGGPDSGFGPMPIPSFAELDADKDGRVTQAEFDAFRAGRVTALDTDKDGKLSAAEITAQAMQRAEARAGDMAAKMIAARDSDGDGLLSAAEMAVMPVPQMIFDRVDSDGDGAITEDEANVARERMAERMERGPRGHGPRGHGPGGWNLPFAPGGADE